MSFVTNRIDALNRSYKRVLELSFILVLLIIIAAFKFAPQNNGPQHFKTQDNDIPVIPEVDPTNLPGHPPPPPIPAVPVVAAIDEEIEDIILPPVDIIPDENIPEVPRPPKPPVEQDELVPFKDLESFPEPIGGMQAIINKIHYTEIAIRAGIEGTVTIKAILGKKGEVLEASVVKKLGGGLDEIALQAVKDTKFIPGMQRDRPVKVELLIPVKFRLVQ